MLGAQSKEIKGVLCVGHVAFPGKRENYTPLQPYFMFQHTWFSKTKLLYNLTLRHPLCFRYNKKVQDSTVETQLIR